MQWKEIKAVVEKASTVVDVAFTHAITAGFCGGAGLIALFFGLAIFGALELSAVLAWPASLALGIATALFGYAWMKPPEEEFIRGIRAISQEEAEAVAAPLTSPGEKGIQFGNVFLPWDARALHFAFVAATRAGKGLLIRLFQQSVLSTFRPGGDNRALIYDNKQDQLRILSGMKIKVPIVTLSPFDARGAEWDIAADCTGYATAIQTAAVLFPPPENDKGDPFWPKAARELLSGILISFQKHSPRVWTFRDVMLALRSRDYLRFIVGREPSTRDRLDYFFEERIFLSMHITLKVEMANYAAVAGLWSTANGKVSLTRWAKGDCVLVVGNNERLRAALDPINQCIIQRAIELLLDQQDSDTRVSLVCLDEVRELAKIPTALRSLLNKGGSKGATALVSYQCQDGMSDRYGELVAREILGECGNICAGRIQNEATAKLFSGMLGEGEYLVPRYTSGPNGSSYTWTREARAAVHFSELQGLPKTNKKNGLRAFFKTADLPGVVWKAHLPGKELFTRMLWRKSKKVPDLIERPEGDEDLKPWTAEDLKRLNLPEDPNTELSKIVGPALTKRLRLFDKAEGKVEEPSLDGLGRVDF